MNVSAVFSRLNLSPKLQTRIINYFLNFPTWINCILPQLLKPLNLWSSSWKRTLSIGFSVSFYPNSVCAFARTKGTGIIFDSWLLLWPTLGQSASGVSCDLRTQTSPLCTPFLQQPPSLIAGASLADSSWPFCFHSCSTKPDSLQHVECSFKQPKLDLVILLRPGSGSACHAAQISVFAKVRCVSRLSTVLSPLPLLPGTLCPYCSARGLGMLSPRDLVTRILPATPLALCSELTSSPL